MLFGTLPPELIQIAQEVHDRLVYLKNRPGRGVTEQQQKTYAMDVQ